MNEQIKLPVRYDGVTECLIDADGTFIAIDIDGDTEHREATAGQIVSALNEADALRAEVEGYRAMLADANRIYYEHPLRVCKTYHGDWAIYDDIGPINDERFNTALAAYAAIKPNAAAGEEGTE